MCFGILFKYAVCLYSLFHFFCISVLIFVILVQAKLNENGRCCLRNYLKKIFLKIYFISVKVEFISSNKFFFYNSVVIFSFTVYNYNNDFIYSVEHKRRILAECPGCSFPYNESELGK